MEVQVGNSSLHLRYLQKIVAQMAAMAGMNRREAEDMSRAVNGICLAWIGSASAAGLKSELSVCLNTCGGCFTTDIKGPRPDESIQLNNTSDAEAAGWFERRAARLVDRIELVRDADGSTIRLTKHAKDLLTGTGSRSHAQVFASSTVH